MFETTGLILRDVLYLLAYLTTAIVYLFWNELITAAWSLIVYCLSTPSSPILVSMLKLHCLVLACFVIATCFHVTIAEEAQHEFSWTPDKSHTLDFDDLETQIGFGYVPDAYHHLNFDGLYPFNPHAEALKDQISPHDINCAVSSPNGLYGARYESGRNYVIDLDPATHSDVPAIHIDAKSAAVFGLQPFFTLHSMKVKPLDIPFSHTTLYLKGYTNETVLHWQVDFPFGYHDMLHVKIEDFSKEQWKRLERLEVFANLYYDGGDWEFCLDDLDIEFTPKRK